jgi:hypothetical protein
MADPQVSFAIVAKNISAKVLADVEKALTGVGQKAGGPAATGLAALNFRGGETRKGMNALEGGLRSLASEALSIPGPLGQVAKGLLLFGGGGAVVLGVTAGLAAIGLAYQFLTRDAKEATKAQQDLADALSKGFKGKEPDVVSTKRTQIEQINAALETLFDQRKAESTRTRFAIESPATAHIRVPAVREEEMDRLDDLILKKQLDLRRASQDFAKALEEAGKDTGGALDNLAKEIEAGAAKLTHVRIPSAAEALGLTRIDTRGLTEMVDTGPKDPLSAGQHAGVEARAAARKALGLVSFGTASRGENIAPITARVATVQRGLDAQEDARLAAQAKTFENAMAVGIAGLGGLAEAALSGGNVFQAAALSISAGISQILFAQHNPIAGAIVGVLGGIAGALFGREKREPQRVQITGLEDQAQRQFRESLIQIAPQPIIQIIAQSTQDVARRVLFEMRGLQSADGIVRVPFGFVVG